MITTKPKRSGWPMAIIAFFVVAILGIITFIIWAVGQDMDLVRAALGAIVPEYAISKATTKRTSPSGERALSEARDEQAFEAVLRN